MPQIFAALTGGPAQTAAQAQRDLAGNVLGMGLPQIGVGQNLGLDYLAQGRGGALDQIGGAVDQSRGDLQSYGANAFDTLTGGTVAGRNALTGANQAYAPLDTLAGRYGGATNLALGALGTRGQGGIDEAQAAFRAGPAYNFNLDQGLEAINRRRNAGGMLNSGNADRDAQTYGSGLASREFDNCMSRLLGFAPLELSATGTAATGRAGLGRDLANLEATQAGRAAGISQQTGQSLADLALRGGLAGAGIEEGFGRGSAGQINTATGQRLGLLGNAANAYGQTYGQEAAAEQQASQNMLNLGQQVLRAVGGSMWGGGPFGGGGGGSLFGGGGGSGNQPNFAATGNPFAFGSGGYTGAGPFLP
jgi:hypothetical protein